MLRKKVLNSMFQDGFLMFHFCCGSLLAAAQAAAAELERGRRLWEQACASGCGVALLDHPGAQRYLAALGHIYLAAAAVQVSSRGVRLSFGMGIMSCYPRGACGRHLPPVRSAALSLGSRVISFPCGWAGAACAGISALGPSQPDP